MQEHVGTFRESVGRHAPHKPEWSNHRGEPTGGLMNSEIRACHLPHHRRTAGTVPRELGAMENLRLLHVDNNKLTSES